jgi:hypothetical protein
MGNKKEAKTQGFRLPGWGGVLRNKPSKATADSPAGSSASLLTR